MRRLALLLALAAVLAAPAATADAPFMVAEPSWSPDGNQLAFTGSVGAGESPDVYAVDVDGTNLRDLTPDDPAPNFNPSWGRRLADIAYETDFSNALVATVRYSVVSPDGTSRRDLITWNAIGPIWWSAGDRYLAFDGRLDADFIRSDGSAHTSIPNAISGPFAPRTLRAAFSLATPNDRIHLYTLSATGRAKRQLTRGRESTQAFAWSRDGRWILFGRNRGNMDFDLYVVRAAGGTPRLLAGDVADAEFAPNGKRVVYSSYTGGVYTIGVDGRHGARLTSDGGEAKWSPTGAWIAFTSADGIDLIRPDGSQRHTLVGSG